MNEMNIEKVKLVRAKFRETKEFRETVRNRRKQAELGNGSEQGRRRRRCCMHEWH